MARLKVYGVHEYRDSHMPDAVMRAVGSTHHSGQGTYFVAHHRKVDASTRLQQLGFAGRPDQLRVVELGPRDLDVAVYLAVPGDVVAWRNTRPGDAVAFIAACDTGPRVLGHWGEAPGQDGVESYRRRHTLVLARAGA